jgi:hypothetical protein
VDAGLIAQLDLRDRQGRDFCSPETRSGCEDIDIGAETAGRSQVSGGRDQSVEFLDT